MWPKKEAQILEGGSIYWVIKGLIQCRQRIERLDEVTGGDGIRRCAIVLDPEIIRVNPAPAVPFKGGVIWPPRMPPATFRPPAPTMTSCRPSSPARWPNLA